MLESWEARAVRVSRGLRKQRNNVPMVPEVRPHYSAKQVYEEAGILARETALSSEPSPEGLGYFEPCSFFEDQNEPTKETP